MKSQMDIDPIDAFLNGKTKVLLATCFQNERPLQGLAGRVDWKFGGEISNYLRKGVISGQEGECTYIPLRKNGQLYNLILLGCGLATIPGSRTDRMNVDVKGLKNNLKSLKLSPIAISRSDCDTNLIEILSKELKGSDLWIVQ